MRFNVENLQADWRRNLTPGDIKGFWTTIGAAWAHQDGKGFSVKLDYLPLNGGAEIVIREPRAEQAPAD